ncbi:MAG: hypothetical protein KDJ97_12270 [Anaerolineae bacterium]|nr:hypothetical protein [Anaerolineae bacterium]
MNINFNFTISGSKPKKSYRRRSRRRKFGAHPFDWLYKLIYFLVGAILKPRKKRRSLIMICLGFMVWLFKTAFKIIALPAYSVHFRKRIKRLTIAWRLSKDIRLMDNGVYLEYKPNTYHRISL